MDKRIKRLKKALMELGIDCHTDKFTDGNGEWLGIDVVKGDKCVLIEIRTDGDISVYQSKLIWSESDEGKVI